MLRLIVALLALANGVFFAWQTGWLGALGLAQPPYAQTDHMAQQVHPERLIVMQGLGTVSAATIAAARTTAPTASAPDQLAASNAAGGALSSSGPSSSAPDVPAGRAQCLEAGPFTGEENRLAIQQIGKVLNKGSWATQAVSVPGLWLVYMGPYADADALQHKLTELRRIKSVSFEEVRSPTDLALGVSLGRFADERQANAALETMRLRGIRTARVVTARPAMELTVLRVPAANEADQQKVSALPLPAGKGFIACAG